jgi:predicted LPLAT superfamily acyltransferase
MKAPVISTAIPAKTPRHWSEHKEEAAGYWQMRLLLILFRLLPVYVLRILTFPVGFFYYLFSKKRRNESLRYLEKAIAEGEGKINSPSPLRHILAFSLTLVEKLESWGGKFFLEGVRFGDDDIRDLKSRLERGEGALLICSHLGNAELLRALAAFNRTGVSREISATAIVEGSVTAHFNRMLRELNPQAIARIIDVHNFGPDTGILLQDRLAAGELVVIAGDRTSINTRNKYFLFPFLGEDAPFAYGPFFLAALLNVPTYFVFALRQKDISLDAVYDMKVRKSAVSFDCPRKDREARIRELARNFAVTLEGYCKQYPYQWYNFYDFWAKPEDGTDVLCNEGLQSPPAEAVHVQRR